MPAAAPEGPPAALSLAEKAVCKVVYGAPRPRPLLLPVGLELWLYLQKMRDLRGKRCGGWAGTCRGGAVGLPTWDPLPGASPHWRSQRRPDAPALHPCTLGA